MGTSKNIRVLIIEDEIHAQRELTRLLNELDYPIEILDYIDSVEDAVNWLNLNPEPDLMFFDIQLADGLSFEIFTKTDVSCPVIFTTAFDEYAIRAFKVNSIDYLLKPVKQDQLSAALEKYSSQQVQQPKEIFDLSKLAELLNINKPKYKTRFLSKLGDQILHISIDDIAYFISEDNVTFIVTKTNSRCIIDHSLDTLSALVDPDIFFRINRSTLASMKSIKKINKYFNSRLHIELDPGTSDSQLISRVKVQEFLKWIDR